MLLNAEATAYHSDGLLPDIQCCGNGSSCDMQVRQWLHVGGLTDLGAIFDESGEKMLAGNWPAVGANQMLLHAKCF